ncbi:alpha/beta hydrolase [Christiangramia sp. OXR-203]|uniref:alpha/beta hydrolase n=1 Tax=Christiangramia sp. OXR-203 TaxID=3100176 RepID=UPI002AC8C1AE|nr:alpha/beta hydrolase-fold protein [Christiangramia sp. OXR-203]WPY99559.1 alpha/beta hydrolase-fold protein [Christiangramia sp. OXR-203]
MRNLFSIILLSFFCPTLLMAQSTLSKNVKTFEIEAPQLNSYKKIWIYLPANYDLDEQKYPVIYMHDAQNVFDDSTAYAGEWNVDEFLDETHSEKAIIVAIEHGGDKRISELTPYPNEKYGGGNGKNYVDFIRYTLKPHIDASYRTLADQANTGIFGSSLGGLISFYAAFEYPEVFSKIGVFSPSFWFSEQIYEKVKNSEITNDQKFYILAGKRESDSMVEEVNTMQDLLISKGFEPQNLIVKLVEDGEHNEKLWRENFSEAYQWLIEPIE